ncbi:uncharacterized protein CDV56_102942 [Aspergillus thermomutatus]|uniref:Uncharacterized protein n=1 Tax=Aspergillus thermomutatus TaxID=41047 RepID=A0A397HUT5_ASPTH|nr:uncharacterized protein CDV56_102942 [Aspergillus thermomutatus]RHZ64903.1 hypothetical protein CDV56_102942 [Aspergillus thermomutatus]
MTPRLRSPQPCIGRLREIRDHLNQLNSIIREEFSRLDNETLELIHVERQLTRAEFSKRRLQILIEQEMLLSWIKMYGDLVDELGQMKDADKNFDED